MLLSEKITLTMLLLTVIFLVISGDTGLEVFLILILIGMLIIRELIEMFAPSELKVRMNLFIYTGVIIFFVLVIDKVFDAILSIFFP